MNFHIFSINIALIFRIEHLRLSKFDYVYISAVIYAISTLCKLRRVNNYNLLFKGGRKKRVGWLYLS